METIYDFNPTKKEQIVFGLGNKEKYLHVVDQNSANLAIAEMLWDRKDNRYKKYADRLPIDMKNDFYRIIYHP